MTPFGRWCMLAPAAMLIGCAVPAMADLSSLTVIARDGGVLVVQNPTAASIRIQGAVAVEGFDGRTWKPLITEMNLVGSCPVDGIAVSAPAVTLGPGQRLVPPPWRGWSCSGQCEGHCRSNIYWGSGPFRFRLSDATGKSIVTDSFRMPARPDR